MNGENLPAPPNQNHNPDGTFAHGNTAHGNKEGVNGNTKGFQKAGPRSRHYLEKPAREIVALTQDPEKMLDLPMLDYLVLTRISGATKSSNEGRKNTQEVFDRAYGKSTQMLGSDPENPFVSPLPEKFPTVEEAAKRYLAETKARPE